MLNIDKMSRVPIYEQLINGYKELILAGIMKGGDQMPSVRSLSHRLGVNPNTIQKAYLELDRLGLIVSAAGRGSYVTKNAADIIKSGERERLTELSELVRDLLEAGVTADELRETVDNAVKEFNKKA